MKYKLGDKVYWVESHTHFQKKIPCTMCFGKRYVTVIMGDDSQVKSLCGFCSHGLEDATGQATTWEPTAIIRSGNISGISTMNGTRYEVGRCQLPEHDLFDSEVEAEKERLVQFEKVKNQADTWFKDNFVNCTKNQVWSAGYHKQCIEREERSILWHQIRLGIIKDAKNDPEPSARKV